MGPFIVAIRIAAATIGKSACSSAWRPDSMLGGPVFAAIKGRRVRPLRSCSWDNKFGLVKISPLANWTKQDVWARIIAEDIPYNPLHDQGYPSIGCWPCTRPTVAGEGDRVGRWSGHAKTECGLHTPAE